MSILLTDKERCRLEQDNFINVILDANRKGYDINAAYISDMLHIDLATVQNILSTLKIDKIIQ